LQLQRRQGRLAHRDLHHHDPHHDHRNRHRNRVWHRERDGHRQWDRHRPPPIDLSIEAQIEFWAANEAYMEEEVTFMFGDGSTFTGPRWEAERHADYRDFSRQLQTLDGMAKGGPVTVVVSAIHFGAGGHIDDAATKIELANASCRNWSSKRIASISGFGRVHLGHATSAGARFGSLAAPRPR